MTKWSVRSIAIPVSGVTFAVSEGCGLQFSDKLAQWFDLIEQVERMFLSEVTGVVE